MCNIYLVRSPIELVEKSRIGIGWTETNFAECSDAEKAIDEINKHEGVGRSSNQIRRYYDIKDGDIIICPFPYTVVIGKAKGPIFYDEQSILLGRPNQRNVEFYTDSEGKLKFFLRNEFKEALQRRLKTQWTISDLQSFSEDILKTIESFEQKGDYTWADSAKEKILKKNEETKELLLRNIQKGDVNIQTSGFGLEQLICELLRTDGYTAKILSKRTFSGEADADILASKSDRLTDIDLLLQIKHHDGFTNSHGLDQLVAIREQAEKKHSGYSLVLVTSASLSDDLQSKAQEKGITVIDGEELVDWIFEKLDSLSEETKLKLGIFQAPQLI
jgi:restriction system protein